MHLHYFIWFSGLVSGFSIMLTGYTLNFWLAKEGVNLKTLGVFSLISLPYSINFLWAPILDKAKFFLTKKYHRLVSLIIIQSALSVSLLLIGFSGVFSLFYIAIFAFFVALFSSTQDTILGAIRTELLPPEKQGSVSGTYIFGYRIGMLASSSGAIYLSTMMSWQDIYILSAIIIILFVIIFWFVFRNLITNLTRETETLAYVRKTLFSYKKLNYLALVLFFLIMYRLPDNLISTMINPFLLLKDYSEIEIATIGKFGGVISAILGGLIASKIMRQEESLLYYLLLFGSVHSAAHLLFVFQSFYDKNIAFLAVIVLFGGVTGGMAMSSYIAYITSLCRGKYRATQYAFLSSMMGVSRSIIPALSGYIADIYGWTFFFLTCFIISLVPLLLIHIIKNMTKE